MATLTVTWTWDTSGGNTQSFVATLGANTSAPPNSLGLAMSISGKNKSNANHWDRTLTYETMGVPTGSTITGITAASCQSRCIQFTTGATSTAGNCVLVDGATTVVLSGTRSFSAIEGSFTTTNGVDTTGLSKPSSNSVTLTLNNTLVTGNSTSAALGLAQNNLVYTITYTPAGTVTYIPPRRSPARTVNRVIYY